jgi:hypothetical protein
MTNLIISIWALNIWIQLVLIKGELKRIADALEKRGESEGEE